MDDSLTRCCPEQVRKKCVEVHTVHSHLVQSAACALISVLNDHYTYIVRQAAMWLDSISLLTWGLGNFKDPPTRPAPKGKSHTLCGDKGGCQ